MKGGGRRVGEESRWICLSYWLHCKVTLLTETREFISMIAPGSPESKDVRNSVPVFLVRLSHWIYSKSIGDSV